jgi:membrane associated rhomboid family serine protease
VIPLKDYNPTKRTAYVTLLLIAINVAVFVLVQPVGHAPLLESDPQKSAGATTAEIKFDLYNASIPCEVVHGRPLTETEVEHTFGGEQPDATACESKPQSGPFYPGKSVYLALLFSMFLHGGWLHLLGNMLFLWVFGNNIEDTAGPFRYVIFYLLAGLVADFAHIAAQPSSTVPVVGASGAIAGVMGAYLVLFPNVRIKSLLFFGFFFMFRDISAKWLLGFWFIFQFFTAPNSGVAWVAHVGGFAFGVLAALVWKAVSRPEQPQTAVPWA